MNICIDCQCVLTTRGNKIKRCWKCHKLNIKSKKHCCVDCGKPSELRVKTVRCRKCANGFLSKLKTGKHRSLEAKKSISRSMIKRWSDIDYKNKVVKNIIKSNNIFPNKCESIILNILYTLFKNEYKYIGDGNIIIGGFNPDFINEKDKKIIEFFGDYWHGKIDYIKRDKRRLKMYTNHGYETLIIWESELRDNIDYVVSKILRFKYGK